MAEAEYKSKFEPIEETPYLDLPGELWSVFCRSLEKIDHVTSALLFGL